MYLFSNSNFSVSIWVVLTLLYWNIEFVQNILSFSSFGKHSLKVSLHEFFIIFQQLHLLGKYDFSSIHLLQVNTFHHI